MGNCILLCDQYDDFSIADALLISSVNEKEIFQEKNLMRLFLF